MATLGKDGIAALLDPKRLKQEIVDVPLWGTSVIVRELTALGSTEYEASIVSADNKPDALNFRAKLVARCLVDDQGVQLFTPDQLAQASAVVVGELYAVAVKMNGMGAGVLEDAEKNSERGPDA